MPRVKAKIALVLCPPFWTKTPPLALEYLRNYLKNQAEVDIFDLNSRLFKALRLPAKEWLRLDKGFEDSLFAAVQKKAGAEIEDLVKKLAAYDYVGLSVFKRNLNFSLELAKKIKALSSRTTLIFGGPEVREAKERLPRDSIKVDGEGELPLWRLANGDSARHFSRDQIDDLDTLPFNDFAGYDLSLYKPVLPLLSSRGCIRRCSFCAECTLYSGFRQHSHRYTADQIERLVKRHAVTDFSFQDSLINADPAWLNDLCGEILKRGLTITWEAQLMIREGMSDALLRLMKQAGCQNLFIGLESGSDKTLRAMRKGFNASQAARFLARLKKAGLRPEISIIAGYPGESEDDFAETLGFIKDNKLAIAAIAQVSSFTLYKNSTLAERKDNGLLCDTTITKRMKKIARLIEKEKIRHKKAFINNLAYA
ncbi:B12-binding domain-containing radical SAM protein [Candidatus Omnitrophota bacterium]